MVERQLDPTKPGQDSRSTNDALGGQKTVSTDLVAGRGGPKKRGRQTQVAHLSLPFWMEAWPRLALSKSGEFRLRFVLVERTLFCWGRKSRSVVRSGSLRALPPPWP